jgi:hypothetical protein
MPIVKITVGFRELLIDGNYPTGPPGQGLLKIQEIIPVLVCGWMVKCHRIEHSMNL